MLQPVQLLWRIKAKVDVEKELKLEKPFWHKKEDRRHEWRLVIMSWRWSHEPGLPLAA